MDHLRTMSIGGASFTSFVVGLITQSNVAWAIGILAGLATIASGYYSFRQHKRAEHAAMQKSELHHKLMEKVQTELEVEKLKVEHYKRHLEDKLED